MVDPALQGTLPGESVSAHLMRRLFAKPQLEVLFGDYLSKDVRGLLHFTPPEDERISVLAKLGVPRQGGEATEGAPRCAALRCRRRHACMHAASLMLATVRHACARCCVYMAELECLVHPGCWQLGSVTAADGI